MRALTVALTMAIIASPAVAETVSLYAAGRLKPAMTEVAKAFEAKTGHKIEAKYGPSGLLKDGIAGGAAAQVFTSANMEHPKALHDAKKSGPAMLFVRNRLCALVKPGLRVKSESLLDRMLDSRVKLGTATPKADPSGDYAFEVFRKAETIKPGARVALEKKALQLTGGAGSAAPPTGRTVYGWHVAEGRADIFLTYCTNAVIARKENPEQQVVALPRELAVGADYGLTVMNDASPAAKAFAQFIMFPDGQKIFLRYGFTTVK